jgi:thiamine-monophosphate kinase
MTAGRHTGSDAGDGEDPVAGSGSGSAVDRLGPGVEFDLIRGFFAGGAAVDSPHVRVGPGDDCVVLTGSGTVISVDLSIEHVHFRRDWLDAEEIGFRAASAALSDLAAMGAEAIGLLAALAVVEDDANAAATAVMHGVRAAAEGVGGVVLGGDLTRSPGPLILDVTVVGRVSEPILRSGGMAGDELWVTGDLGGAAFSIERLLAGESVPGSIRTRFAAPTPRIREAIWLRERNVPRAMIDISDGVAGDAGHLAKASGLSAVLDATALPVHPEVRAAVRPENRAIALVLTGGEDYELCFATRPGALDTHREHFERTFDVPLTRIGRLEPGAGVFIERSPTEREAIDARGFQHFGGSG